MRLLLALTAITLSSVMLSSRSYADDAKTRTWTDATGAFTVVAELVGIEDGKVQLKRADGKVVSVEIERLSSADQQFIASQQDSTSDSGSLNIALTKLTGKPSELKNDDGEAAGKKSFPRGIASAFAAPEGDCYLTSVRIHGSRYGTPRPPKEDFQVTLCDKDFKRIADFDFEYSKFTRGEPEWVTLRCKPTKVPKEFVICVNFAPTSTKGVFVSHDKEGESLVGLPGKKAGTFTGGDWLLRVSVDKPKDAK